MKLARPLSALFLILLALPALAHHYVLGSLRIGHPWSRAMPAMMSSGAVYLKLDNQGKTADRLLAVSTPRAASAELHQHLNDKGVMRMRAVTEGIELPPGQTITLAPGGLHIMLMGLTAPLKAGERFPLTLRFSRAGTVEVEVKIEEGMMPSP
ncbi:copper chaperone PCu(A)C [Pseudogulbenkiania sp. MAI-1]|uniref:copper chaperone PCu(A)C n=1 Tax=Pseudogulbenkiania sp. MAI-1 TaxID=990370 RepID=UPI00045EA253|nr:copper chaperone PCu(A)C [Pseudogulbenkiania sp. MAI-1]